MTKSSDIVPRVVPLAPRAVLARGPAALALGRKLRARLGEEAVRGLCSVDPTVLLLLGPPEALPWVDGATWFGLDAAAPQVYLPTSQRPLGPADLVERGLQRLHEGPVLYDLATHQLYPLAEARTVSLERLTAWLEAAQ